MSKVALLEYQVVIHDIFLEVLMNRKVDLNKQNIKDFKNYMKGKLKYFQKWRESAVALRRNSNKKAVS